MVLIQNSKANQDGNYFGWENVKIIKFNYDGNGSALAICDGFIDEFTSKCLRDLFWDADEDGNSYYVIDRRVRLRNAG